MKFRVREGCELLHPDGSPWARAGDVVEVAVDSSDPSERTRAGKLLAGQENAVVAAPHDAEVAGSNRSMSAPVKKKAVAQKKVK